MTHSNHDDEVDFVIAPTADTGDDEVLDSGPPHRTDRRVVVALVITALVVVGVVVAVRTNGTDHPAAESTNSSSPSSTSFRPAVPTFPTLAPADPADGPTVNLGPQLCLPRYRCFHPATPASVRAKITVAIRVHLGAVRHLRIRDSRLTTGTKPLFARSITGVTPRGYLTIVAAAVASNSNIVTPTVPGNRSAIGAETSHDGFVVNGSVSSTGYHNGLRELPDINGLVDDDSIVAVR